MATLTHERISPDAFIIEMKMPHGNFLFDRIIMKELKHTMERVDPEADIRKVG
jgi:predicted glycosyltransferase